MLRLGDTLDEKYLLEKHLGEGGMGVVFLARHKMLERHVAIKALHAHIAVREDAMHRFFREARAAAAIKHRGLLEIHDICWHTDGCPYIVMEYLSGEGFERLLVRHKGQVTAEVLLPIIVEVLSVLATVHEHHIIHRDLKPENIFLCDSSDDIPLVKILDFGISKVRREDETAPLTCDDEILGTIPYMAPEQVQAATSVDERTDIWSVGAIMFQALTGRYPFSGGNVHDMAENILEQPLRAPIEFNEAMSTELNAIICKALSKDITLRYQTAGEFRKALLASWNKQALAGAGTSPLVSPAEKAMTLEQEVPHSAALLLALAAEGTPGRDSDTTYCLRVVQGADTGQLLEIKKEECFIGRDTNCLMPFRDDGVSRRHARLNLRLGKLTIYDLRSKNGVTVNGKRISQSRLTEGDVISLGNATLLKCEIMQTVEEGNHRRLFERLAFDCLTAALDRRSLDSRMATEWAHAVRRQQPLSVIALDFDDFARLNEQFGHEFGDTVLEEASRAIRGSIRGEDLFGRIRGNTFALVLQGVPNKEAMRFSRRLRKKIEKLAFHLRDQPLRVTISLGVATGQDGEEHSPTTLLATAERRLHRAKKQGKNREVGS